MNCVLCQSSEFDLAYKEKDWKIVKCSHCGLVKTERRVKPGYGQYHRDEDYCRFENLFHNIFLKRVNLAIYFAKTPGRVLEIGCSTGIMLEIFKERGWQTWGVEPSRASAAEARKRGIKVIKGYFEKVKLSNNYFDLVVINHTLEHMDNPVRVLQKIYRVLKKGGYLLVDVPNFDSLGSRLLGQNWPYLLPLEHNFQFTHETLEEIFKKTGFKIVHFESRSGIFDCASPFLEIWQAFITFKKRFFTNLLTFPYALFVTLLNGGDSMSMIGRKI